MLTNIQFIQGLECLKKLFLYAKTPTKNIFSHEISDYKKLVQLTMYPGGYTSKGLSKENKINFTNEKLTSKNVIIYDALFQYEKQGYASCDVLQIADGKVECIFISPSTELNDTYFYNCAYSIYIMRRLGISIHSIKIVYVNKSYVHVESNLKVPTSFWKVHDVTYAALKFQNRIEQKFNAQLRVLESDVAPEAEIAHHCFKPSVCTFKEQCWGSLPENNIFKMKSMRLGKKLGYYYRGIESMEQLVEKNINFNDNQRIQLKCSINNEVAIDYEGIEEWLNPILKSRYVLFLDFETIAPIIPVYPGATAYTRIPFQYSLHWLDLNSSELSHEEYLADQESGLDTRCAFLKSLLNACEEHDEKSKIIIYNKSFENSVIKDLIVDFPEAKDRLIKIQNRLYDLMEVFSGINTKPLYYDPRFENSYSLKTVLPILTSESYNHLEIKNGLTASIQYYNLLHSTPQEREEIRSSLLKYCKQDTYATVKIFQYLLKLSMMKLNNSNNIKTYENGKISKRVSKRTS